MPPRAPAAAFDPPPPAAVTSPRPNALPWPCPLPVAVTTPDDPPAVAPDAVVMPFAACPFVTVTTVRFVVAVVPAGADMDEATVVVGAFRPRLTAPIVVP